jgi:hypothetical protein
MALNILIRIVGIVLLVIAGYFGVKSWHQILPLKRRAIKLFVASIVGLIGSLCALAGDLLLAALLALGVFPFALVTVMQLYFAERKQLRELQMYKARYRQALDEGNEDEMVDLHALVHSCRRFLPYVQEAQKEDWEE